MIEFTKGLMKFKRYEKLEANNIQEYICALEELKGDHYFRGEPSISFDGIVASAFRPYPIRFSGIKKNVNYQEALDEYYREVAHELTELERENFLAYAQHHGLPTPLVDITSNPMVALYFACSTMDDESTGRVYAFNKNRFLDFSLYSKRKDMTLNNFFLDNEFTYNVLTKIHELDDEAKTQLLYDCLQNLKKGAEKTGPLYNSKFVGIEPTATMTLILKEILKISEDNVALYVESFKKIFLSHFHIDFKFHEEKKQFRTKLSFVDKEEEPFFELHYDKYISDEDAVIILFLIRQQSENMVDDFLHNERLSLEEFSSAVLTYGVIFPPIVIYPTVKFERMRIQEGAFLYQVPHFRGELKDYIGFAQIIPDVEIIINNKKEFLCMLELLGVNQKSVFPDHDNIAAYLKNKQLLK